MNKNQNQLAIVKKDIVDVVSRKIGDFQKNGELHLPANYSPSNALKSAFLILQNTVDRQKKPVLQVCTQDSIANALLDMVVQGLNPAKKQMYFIAYGNQLACQRSYFGTMAVVKQLNGVRDVYAQVVYEGDTLKYGIERGKKVIQEHIQELTSVNPDKIIAAYCVVEFDDDKRNYTDIMTISQIKKSWTKSKMNPSSEKSTHKQFPEEMCRRTIINRACKNFINSSSDSGLLIEHLNRQDQMQAEGELETELTEQANQGDIIDVETTTGEAVNVETGEVTAEGESLPDDGIQQEPDTGPGF